MDDTGRDPSCVAVGSPSEDGCVKAPSTSAWCKVRRSKCRVGSGDAFRQTEGGEQEPGRGGGAGTQAGRTWGTQASHRPHRSRLPSDSPPDARGACSLSPRGRWPWASRARPGCPSPRRLQGLSWPLGRLSDLQRPPCRQGPPLVGTPRRRQLRGHIYGAPAVCPATRSQISEKSG